MNKFIPGTDIINSFKNRFYAGLTIPNESGCMEWVKGIEPNGYGVFADRVNNKLSPHRMSYMLHYGEIPGDLCVLHKCDNRKCAAPDHLFLGTKADNCRDRTRKNRQAKGETQGSAKLSHQQVVEILLAIKAGEHQPTLASKFNVTRQCIWLIANRKNWKHVEENK